LLHDVFICHASEDKDDFVRSLAEALRTCHLEVWYDEFSLTVGDSLRQSIDRGLANSQFGIVVLSPAFFRKRWTQREMNGLVAREMSEGRELVLPIWHGVDHAEIVKYSPPLADVRAINSSSGLETIVAELLRRLRPEESPLIIARDFLISKGVTPPIVTHEWWLDVVEFKEGELRFPDLNVGHRWIFPLPFDAPDRGKERGLNIAWTALQLDWMQEGNVEQYCQLTDPERIHSYLRKWPGLLDCCLANPSIIALYAPQLTIPGYDDGLVHVFDDLLKRPYNESLHFSGYSRPDTIDGKEPLCGEAIAWRHPLLGNFTDGELASSFARAHTHHYARGVHEGFVCLVWLLTEASNWLPDHIRSRLLNGMKMNTYTWATSVPDSDNTFFNALFARSKSKFRLSRDIRAGLESLIAASIEVLGLSESATSISRRFVEEDLVGAFFDQQDRWRRVKSKNV
jgi:hypothetical protein